MTHQLPAAQGLASEGRQQPPMGLKKKEMLLRCWRFPWAWHQDCRKEKKKSPLQPPPWCVVESWVTCTPEKGK